MIYVTEESKMQTGYSAKEAVGKNCRFLQGSDTKPHSVEATSDVNSPGCLSFGCAERCEIPRATRLATPQSLSPDLTVERQRSST